MFKTLFCTLFIENAMKLIYDEQIGLTYNVANVVQNQAVANINSNVGKWL